MVTLHISVLQRPGERQKWQNVPDASIQQPHDDDSQPTIKRKTYYSPNHSYCVETACAPCGVVIAWTKFPKSKAKAVPMMMMMKVILQVVVIMICMFQIEYIFSRSSY